MNGACTSSDRADLHAALAHHQAGRLENAEILYQRILSNEPDDPDALNLLGLIRQERGDLTGSIALLSRAVELDPEFPDALTNLARAARASGRPADALEHAHRATRIDPDLPEAWLQLGRASLDVRQPLQAADAARRAIALDPGMHDAHWLLGLSLVYLNEYREALQSCQTAHRLAPRRPDILISLGGILTDLGETEDALAVFRKAAALAPDDATAAAGVAVSLQRANDINGSILACRQALELAPERADLWRLQGTNFAATGNFAAAAKHFHRSLALEPGSPEAQRFLTRIGQLGHESGEIASLRHVSDDAGRSPRERIAAGFALGNALDQAGCHADAFIAYAGANQLVRGENLKRGVIFEPDALDRHVDRVIANFRADVFPATRHWGDPSETPVFVVGMPRSGTTLVEQIMATHARVHGKGESKAIPKIVEMIEAGETGRPVLSWDKKLVRQLATTHASAMRNVGTGIDRVVDKLPDNILLLGHIAVLFPNARVVMCRRDLRDVCLSNYFQHFDDGMAWTYDLADCAARARSIERLTAHWRAALPLRMLEIHYETLVSEPESQTRRLIDFLDLDWDPRCLRFHATERTVLTASQWQVRQPLYATSVNRWRNYHQNLAPLLERLRGVLPADEAM